MLSLLTKTLLSKIISKELVCLYRLGTTLVHVEDPHLFEYKLFDRLTNNKIGTITRVCKCKYSMKNGNIHCYHQAFTDEFTVVELLDGREFSYKNKQFGKVLSEINEEVFGFNRYIKEQRPIPEILQEVQYLSNKVVDKADNE